MQIFFSIKYLKLSFKHLVAGCLSKLKMRALRRPYCLCFRPDKDCFFQHLLKRLAQSLLIVSKKELHSC